MFLDVPVTSNDSKNSAVIGGAVGGVMLLLMITVVLCIVIVCIRRSHKEREYKFACNTTKLNTVNLEDSTKTNTDPAYELCTGDTKLNINPAYGVSTEDSKKDTDPAYGVSTGEDRTTGFSVAATNSATTKRCDCSYVCDDHLSHNNTAANIHDTVNQRKKPSLSYFPKSAIHVNEDEYGAVNH